MSTSRRATTIWKGPYHGGEATVSFGSSVSGRSRLPPPSPRHQLRDRPARWSCSPPRRRRASVA